MNWYYVKDAERHGPVSGTDLAELARAGTLGPDDLVWNEEQGDSWAAASTVPGLFETDRPTPPPFPPPLAAVGPGEEAASPPLSAEDADAPPPSCIKPLDEAWRRMVVALFAPFDLGKWFALGFGAWLATLGDGSGSFPSLPGGNPWRQEGGLGELLGRAGAQPWNPFAEGAGNLMLIVLLGGAGLLIVVGIGLGVTWLRARGAFIFLDNVVHGRAAVAEPWRRFQRLGHSLFLWWVVYGAICLMVVLVLVALTAVTAVMPCVRAGTVVLTALPGMVFCALLWLVFVLVTAFVTRFLEDFVIPIMYRFDLSAVEAWRRFFPLLSRHVGAFVLYALFRLVLNIAAGSCRAAFMIFTCCLGGACLLLLPYLGAVIVLPITVFFRSYSLAYLAQLGPEYRLVERR